jgi:hypothetical protein
MLTAFDTNRALIRSFLTSYILTYRFSWSEQCIPT